jgi:prevent-host-death family protein
MTELCVGVREFKIHLSKYLREVMLGKTILITKHGRLIGRLIPAETNVAVQLEAMRLAGIISWNGEKLSITPPLARIQGAGSVADLILPSNPQYRDLRRVIKWGRIDRRSGHARVFVAGEIRRDRDDLLKC